MARRWWLFLSRRKPVSSMTHSCRLTQSSTQAAVTAAVAQLSPLFFDWWASPELFIIAEDRAASPRPWRTATTSLTRRWEGSPVVAQFVRRLFILRYPSRSSSYCWDETTRKRKKKKLDASYLSAAIFAPLKLREQHSKRWWIIEKEREEDVI